MVGLVVVTCGTYVNRLILNCFAWNAATRRCGEVLAGRTFEGMWTPGVSEVTVRCEFKQQPVKTLRGRAASLVDAVGVTCDEP